MTRYQEIRRRVRGSRAKSRRGVALILVLGALVILTVFATELQERTGTALGASRAELGSLQAEYHARSSINLTRLLISTEPIVRKAINPLAQTALKKPLSQVAVWEFTELVLGPFNCPENSTKFTEVTGASIASGKNLGSSGCFETPVIVPEEGLININAGVAGDPASLRDMSQRLLGLFGQPVYNEFFEEPDADGQHSDQPTICSAIMDWADFDEVSARCEPVGSNSSKSTEGTEDNYYQTLGLPYQRKNAPYDSLEELRLIRGVSDDFWANFVDPNPQDPKERTVTVWGSGKVDVNSANPQTLLALVCAHAPDALLCNDIEQMSAFLMGFSLAKQISQGIPLFPTPKSFIRAMQGKGKGIGPLFQTMGVEPVEFQSTKALQKSITTEARVFSIYATGVVTGRERSTRKRIHTVVDFRSANELGQEPEELPDLPPEPDPENPDAKKPATTPAPTPTPTADLTPEELAKALASDPLGVIIYHRLD